VVYRDVTRQAKGLYRLKHEVVLKRGLAYLSRYNSDWFCHRGGEGSVPHDLQRLLNMMGGDVLEGQ
jgi:hypothetical protein